jgi:SAM-dependent methyltransferase
VDFGCGSGAWLAGAEQLGATRLRGFDGPWVDPRALTSDRIEFTPMNFEQELPELDDTFDLAISVEVAEHLSKARAEALIQRLTTAADVIVFSAAVPMQGGTHHINEHPQSYWIGLFDDAGFDVFDIFRPALWSDQEIRWWFRQNIFLFVRRGSEVIDPEAVRALQGPLVDVVHPENFASKVTSSRKTIAELRARVSELEGRLAAADVPTCYDCQQRAQRSARVVDALRRAADDPRAQRLLDTGAGKRAKGAAKKLVRGLS